MHDCFPCCNPLLGTIVATSLTFVLQRSPRRLGTKPTLVRIDTSPRIGWEEGVGVVSNIASEELPPPGAVTTTPALPCCRRVEPLEGVRSQCDMTQTWPTNSRVRRPREGSWYSQIAPASNCFSFTDILQLSLQLASSSQVVTLSHSRCIDTIYYERNEQTL